jgi:hypothetical protein
MLSVCQCLVDPILKHLGGRDFLCASEPFLWHHVKFNCRLRLLFFIKVAAIRSLARVIVQASRVGNIVIDLRPLLHFNIVFKLLTVLGYKLFAQCAMFVEVYEVLLGHRYLFL